MEDDHCPWPSRGFGFGYARDFLKSGFSGFLDESAYLPGEPDVNALDFAADYAELFLQVGVVYPEVEAAAAQSVGEVSGAVGGEDDKGLALGADGALFRGW